MPRPIPDPGAAGLARRNRRLAIGLGIAALAIYAGYILTYYLIKA